MFYLFRWQFLKFCVVSGGSGRCENISGGCQLTDQLVPDLFILPNPAHKEFGMPNRNKDCVLITDIFYKINPEVFLLKREPGISTNDDFHIADSDYFAAHMRM